MPKKDVEEVEEISTDESDAKKAYRAHLAKYAEQHPEKYALKQAELEAKLNSL